MTGRDWLPSLWADEKGETEYPFAALRNRIDSLMEDFDRQGLIRQGDFAVRSNVSETNGEICITAELPGMEQKDIDVSVSGHTLTIKGQKKSEKEEKKEDEGRQFHRIERSSGSFQRSMTLPFEIDGDKVNADFKSGVLTVTVAKPSEVVEKAKKIQIKQAT